MNPWTPQRCVTHCRKPNSVNKVDGPVQTVRCEHCAQLFTEEIVSLSKAAPFTAIETDGDLQKINEQIAEVAKVVERRPRQPDAGNIERSSWRRRLSLL